MFSEDPELIKKWVPTQQDKQDFGTPKQRIFENQGQQATRITFTPSDDQTNNNKRKVNVSRTSAARGEQE